MIYIYILIIIMTNITDDALFETSNTCIFSTPFKPLKVNESLIINTLCFNKSSKPKPVTKIPIEEKLSHDEILKIESQKIKEKEEEKSKKRNYIINRDKKKEDDAIRRAEDIKLYKLNKEFDKEHIKSGSNKKTGLCGKCKVKMYIDETNFNRLSKDSIEYKRGLIFETICISCSDASKSYYKDNYKYKKDNYYKDFNCPCGKKYTRNIDKNITLEKDRHELSRMHILYKTVNDYNNHLTTSIDFNLFTIGQLRAINTYKPNVKEDLSYIVTNMTIKKKEVIIKELESYDKPIYIPDNILTVHK